MAAERRANADWRGPLLTGSGTVELGSSGLGTFPVSWPSRTEEPNGQTSPEELLAASHAACYAMALSATLARNDTPPERLRVTSTVTFVPKEGGGFQVGESRLEVIGTVPGVDAAKFAELAAAGEEGCPISNALRGNVGISVSATLE